MDFADELITFQAGPLTNRVCAHFWNLQDKLSQYSQKPVPSAVDFFQKQILFDTAGPVPKPRTLVLDLTESIDHNFHSDLNQHSLSPDYFSWKGKVDTVVRLSKGFQTVQSADTVCPPRWTGCLAPKLQNSFRENKTLAIEPQRLNSPPDRAEDHANNRQGSTALSLPSFVQGSEALCPGSVMAEEVEDRLRRTAERCSCPSGFQLLVDAENGFTGVMSRILDHIADEFSKLPVLGIPIYNSAGFFAVSRKHQLIAKANQLALLLRFERANESLSHAAWYPLDVSVYTEPEVCVKTGVLAGVLDNLTSPFRLTPQYGGMKLNEYIFESQKLHDRRMFSTRAGHVLVNSKDCWLQWKSLNPYCAVNIDNFQGSSQKNQLASVPSLWRLFVLRGIPMKPLGSTLLAYASARNETERRTDKILSAELPPDDIRCSFLDPGAKIHAVSCLSDYPISRHMPTKLKTEPVCQQPEDLLLTSFLDAPGDGSIEAIGLSHLVQFLRSYSQHSCPLEGMELDIWRECLELGQIHLVDGYFKSDSSWHL
ncbi:unnamed protein product [Calicophoron daubneyi]|uniref:Misato Segment II tubulin-like domain-containing protein n=1 Tax=Calicophoron daubneyi TaxID=300641 RepID=A0AAV2TNI9_CALDB